MGHSTQLVPLTRPTTLKCASRLRQDVEAMSTVGRCSVAVFEAGIPRCPPPQGAAARSAAPRWPPTARPHEHLRHTPWPGTRAPRARAALSPGALARTAAGHSKQGAWMASSPSQRLLPLVGFQHRLVGQIRRCVPHAMPSARDKSPEVCARLPLEGVESHVGARGLEAARSRRRRGMARRARPPHRSGRRTPRTTTRRRASAPRRSISTACDERPDVESSARSKK